MSGELFQDALTGSDGDNLHDRAGWSVFGGSTTDLQINASNACKKIAGTSGRTLYHAHSSANHYAQIVVGSGATNWASFVAIRISDSSNYIGARPAGTAYQIVRSIAGSLVTIGTWSTTPSAGQVLKIEGDGDDISVYVDGVLRIGPITETHNNTAVNVGFKPRDAGAIDPFWDTWESDILATADAPISTLTLFERQRHFDE